VLKEEGVRLAVKDALKGFCGTAHACAEDLEDRGISEDSLERGVRVLRRDEIDRMLARNETD
jgi:hypothetical protein